MDTQILSFPTLITTLLLPFLLIIILSKILKINNKNPPPGPWKLPLIGNIHQLVNHHLHPHRRLTDLAKTYGPVMSLQLGQVEAVIISSAETAKQVLKIQESQFLGRPSLLAADVMLYNRTDISFAPYGDYWKQMKKISIVELLSAKRVQSYKSSVMEEEVSDFVRFLYSQAGSPVNITKTFYSLGNGIIAKTSIGKKFKNQELFLKVVDKAIRVAGGFSVGDAFPSFKLIHLISGISSTLQQAHQEADQILEEIISEHRANMAAEGDQEGDNILGVLLNIQERGNLQIPITTENIKAIILDMFAGASDTSLTTAEWAMSEMVKNPRTMKKAQEEIRQIFDEKENITNLLPKLTYLKLVIKETLRLHPPVTLIPRECEGRCEVNGYDINPKTKVLVNAWAIGRDPNLWNDPDIFSPERFLDNSIDFKGTNFEFIPFGAGKRICPGITMAVTVIEVLLAQLLYYFDWKLPNGASRETLDMSDTFGLVVKRRIDLNLIPIPNKSLFVE